MTEAQLQAAVVECAEREGWLCEQQLPKPETHQPPLLVETEDIPKGLGDTLVDSILCELELQGEPTTKARPRVVKSGAYTPRRTAESEEAIRWQLLAAGCQPDADHLLRIELGFRSSTGQRRDLDNLVKLVLDACNGFVWRDDFQIVDLHATVERRSINPGTSIRVTRIGRYTADCRRCGIVLPHRKGSGIGQGDYCGRACYDIAQSPGHLVACPECSVPVYRQRSEESRLKFCSVVCSQAYKRGRRSPRWDVGFPTLMLVRGGRLMFCELETERGIESVAQLDWAQALHHAGAETYLWRPKDWLDGTIEATLRREVA